MFAAKVFRPDAYQSAMQLLTAEVELAERLDHPNLVKTFGKMLVAGRWPAIVMEFMVCSLHEYLHKPKPWMHPINYAAQHRIACGVACGLAHMHDVLQMTHRDLKPLNVLLDQQVELVKISDFGLATRFGMETSAVGTYRCNCNASKCFYPQTRLVAEPCVPRALLPTCILLTPITVIVRFGRLQTWLRRCSWGLTITRRTSFPLGYYSGSYFT
jgi:serine/threonine protein kinase